MKIHFGFIKKTALIALMSSGLLANEVNVYSHRHYDTDKMLFKTFEQKTGIRSEERRVGKECRL